MKLNKINFYLTSYIELRKFFKDGISNNKFNIISHLVHAYFYSFTRRHTYKWVILGINTFAIAGGIPWLAAFIWAVWPTNKSLIDPIAGNVTGKGTRNFGDTVGTIAYGRERGYEDERKKVKK